MNNPAEVAKILRQARIGLANDNRLAGQSVNVLLVHDEDGEVDYVADYFMRLREGEDEAHAAVRIAVSILGGTNRRDVTRVAVVRRDRSSSCYVCLADPFNVGYSSEFTPRWKPWMENEEGIYQ